MENILCRIIFQMLVTELSVFNFLFSNSCSVERNGYFSKIFENFAFHILHFCSQYSKPSFLLRQSMFHKMEKRRHLEEMLNIFVFFI